MAGHAPDPGTGQWAAAAPRAPAPARPQVAFPVYYGNSLSAEIAAVRQSYMANGGQDPDILAQVSGV